MFTNTTDPTKLARGSAKARSATKTTKVTLKASVAPTDLDFGRRSKGFSLEGLERRLVALDAAREPTQKELAESYDREDVHAVIKGHPHLPLKDIVRSIAADDPRMKAHARKLLTALLKPVVASPTRTSSRSKDGSGTAAQSDPLAASPNARLSPDPTTVRRPISIDMSAPQDPPSLFEGSPMICGD